MQKSTSTTFPARLDGVRRGELSHSAALPIAANSRGPPSSACIVPSVPRCAAAIVIAAVPRKRRRSWSIPPATSLPSYGVRRESSVPRGRLARQLVATLPRPSAYTTPVPEEASVITAVPWVSIWPSPFRVARKDDVARFHQRMAGVTPIRSCPGIASRPPPRSTRRSALRARSHLRAMRGWWSSTTRSGLRRAVGNGFAVGRNAVAVSLVRDHAEQDERLRIPRSASRASSATGHSA